MKKAKRVTILDIAKEAGVSPATVSLVFNNKGSVAEKRRKFIKKLADEMGYVPNSMARALRGGATGCIGVVINYFSNPFFRAMSIGLEDAAEEAGFTLMMTQSHDLLDREAAQIRMMAEHGVDGLILLPCGKEANYLRDIRDRYNIPVVLIAHTLGGEFAAVEADNAHGAQLVAEHFLSLGKRHNFHLTGPQEKSSLAIRNHAFCSVIQKKDPDFNPETHVFYAKTVTAAGAFETMKEICQRRLFPCSIFAVNDEIALGILNYCRQHNLRVPEDVAVAGFSDMDILEEYGIPLTSVRIPGHRIGENAVELLLEMRKNEKARSFPPTITLPVSLVTRHSTTGK